MRWILLLYRVIRGAIKQAFREEISFSQQHKWGQCLPTWNHVGSHLEPGRVNNTKESLLDCYCVREGKGIVSCNETGRFLLPVHWSLAFIFVYIQYDLFAYKTIVSSVLTKLLFPTLCMCIFLNICICSLKCTQYSCARSTHSSRTSKAERQFSVEKIYSQITFFLLRLNTIFQNNQINKIPEGIPTIARDLISESHVSHNYQFRVFLSVPSFSSLETVFLLENTRMHLFWSWPKIPEFFGTTG